MLPSGYRSHGADCQDQAVGACRAARYSAPRPAWPHIAAAVAKRLHLYRPSGFAIDTRHTVGRQRDGRRSDTRHTVAKTRQCGTQTTSNYQLSFEGFAFFGARASAGGDADADRFDRARRADRGVQAALAKSRSCETAVAPRHASTAERQRRAVGRIGRAPARQAEAADPQSLRAAVRQAGKGYAGRMAAWPDRGHHRRAQLDELRRTMAHPNYGSNKWHRT